MTDSAEMPPRLSAALSGRYDLIRELGEGGMATVYLANDLKHKRKVAVKVLKPELAAVVGAERFLTEIETTANLQHPHILPLHDSGEADGFLFYVMPYVDGETLRQRLDRERQLPVDEGVRIATDMAEALDYAHRAGVIHRDIKPANVLIHEGRPLIADFGIALAVGAAGGARLTETGLSVGTPYYMSPEQATGDQVIGAAADTYSLGCVLYEMLVGEPPYPGATAQAVLGKIIAGAPVSATAIRSSIPANVDAAIRRALEKLPADRFKTTGDFAKALADLSFRHGEAEGAGAGAVEPWRRRALGLAALAGVLAIAAAWGWLAPGSAPEPDPVLRYSLPLPSGDGLFQMNAIRLALSPDGSHIVYAGNPEGGGPPRLYVRSRDQLRGTPLGPDVPAGAPAFSPDGTRVAYFTFAPLGLNVISLGGAPPVMVADSGLDAGGISWGPDGYLYADADATDEGPPSDGIVRVPVGGGVPERVTTPDTTRGELFHKYPDVLPNGKGVLFSVVRSSERGEDAIAVADLATGEHRVVLEGVLGRYSLSGHLVYVTADGTLLVAPFDQESLTLAGDPVAVVQGVRVPQNGAVDLVVSATGTLMYSTGPATAANQHELVWLSRQGQPTLVDPQWTFDPGNANFGFALSPDGGRAAVRILTEAGYDIWIKELPQGPLSRLTFDEAQERMPRWAGDGDQVTFLSARGGDLDVWAKRSDGAGEPILLYDHESFLAQGFWHPSEELLVVRTGGVGNVEGGRDILVVRPGTDSVATPLLATDFDEWAPALSPDGGWIAYQSSETGENEVFVRPFPDVGAGKWQISSGGGTAPLWSHGGDELFFWTVRGELVSVAVETGSGFRAGERQVLFDLGPEYRIPGVSGQYDITPDDQRFLVLRRALSGEDAQNELIVVENWFEELAGLGQP